jgi:hypothetical protein
MLRQLIRTGLAPAREMQLSRRTMGSLYRKIEEFLNLSSYVDLVEFQAKIDVGLPRVIPCPFGAGTRRNVSLY